MPGDETLSDRAQDVGAVLRDAFITTGKSPVFRVKRLQPALFQLDFVLAYSMILLSGFQK